MIEPGRLCACNCGTELPRESKPFRRFLDDVHRKRQYRRAERAGHRELKAAAARDTGSTVIQGRASVSEAFRSTATVR